MTGWLDPPRPYAIAHRGASAYAPGNTLRAFQRAAILGAEFWEVDIRTSSDGVLVAHHDPATASGHAVASLTAAALEAESGTPTLSAVIALARETGTGLYADVKAADPVAVSRALERAGVERAIIAAFDPAAVAATRAAKAPYPLAALVPMGADPFAHAARADIVHLCWEAMDRPQDMLTPAFFERVSVAGQRVVLWHEEDPDRMTALRGLPVLGICSDTPQLVRPFRAPPAWPVRTVAHRGANAVAPENTRPAARAAFAAGADWVELDVRTTSDGVIVTMHDADVARTTDGVGLVADMTFAEIRSLDAGTWFDPHYAGTRVPTLADMLEEARLWDRGLYVEIKSADPLAVLAEVERAGLLGRCFFWGWDYDGLRAIQAARPDARIMTRRMDAAQLSDCFANLRPALIEYDSTDDWGDIHEARAHSADLMICYMGREAVQMDRMIEARPDIVNIDDLALFEARLKAAKPGGDPRA